MSLTDADKLSEDDKNRLETFDKARGRIIAYGTGLLAVIAIAFTASNAKSAQRTAQAAQHSAGASQETAQAAVRTAAATEQGLVTGRYTSAVDQLGSDKLDIRLGGIYALERIARDSERDHPTVMALLSTFICEHSHDDDAHTTTASADLAPTTVRSRFRPDLQAALTVIGRRDPAHDHDPINLAHANLNGADLTRANLNSANLYRTSLVGANLTSANLAGANITDANLTEADLSRANLSGAYLSDANLAGAILWHTNLRRADLYSARLTGANLTGANLTRAIVDSDSLSEVHMSIEKLYADMSAEELYARVENALEDPTMRPDFIRRLTTS